MSTPPSNLPFAPEVSDEELEAELARMSADTPAPAPAPVRPTPQAPVASIQAAPPAARSGMTGSSPAADDMFSGLDQSPKKSPAPMGLGDLPQRSSSSIGKYILLFVVVVIVLGGLGFVFWEFAIHRPAVERAKTVQTAPVPTPVTPTASVPVVPPPTSDTVPLPLTPDPTLPATGSSEPLNDAFAPLPTPVTAPPAGATIPPPESISPTLREPAPTTTTVDTDEDGLSDQRELELGTDPRNKDTDADELSDGDEVLKYGTNPLDRDTDKDSFLDGKEVQNGYNPRGSDKCAKPDCAV